MANTLSLFIPVADAIVALFHPHAEVVIHDIMDDAVFYIANAFSGREVGDPSNLKVEATEFDLDMDVIGPYEKPGANGQRIRSITSVLRDEGGNARGILCVNLDFSALESAMSVIQGFLRPPHVEARPEILFRDEWRELLFGEVRSYLKKKEQALGNLDGQGRKALLGRLDEKGLPD